LKIAYVLRLFPKLSESFVLNEIVELLMKGHDIQIYSIGIPTKEVMHEEINEYALLERIHYCRFMSILKVNSFHLLNHFLKCVILDLWNSEISKIRLKKNLKLAYFATMIEDGGAELIHIHFADMLTDGRKLSKILNIPYSLTAHAHRDELLEGICDAGSVITISEHNKKYLNNEIKINNKIDIIRCGVNLAKFNPQEKLYANGTIKILTVARLVEKKGIEYLIKAIPLVIIEVPNFELTVVGSGELHNYLLSLADKLNISRYIKFKGDIPDSDLKECYKDADIFVLPCIITDNGERDGIPVSIMEAMAMELSVISTNVSGIPELVEDGVSGILLQPKDEKSIASAIVTLSKDRKLRVEMGKAGRKIIEDKFNLKIEVEKLSELFMNIKRDRHNPKI
jgi:colanic acid/amylovoran biosynthesis glycosyltransferase